MAEEKIQPALTAEEWTDGGVRFPRPPEYSDWIETGYYIDHGEVVYGLVVEGCDRDMPLSRPAALIALLNAALPDSDPRKITREWVHSMREAADAIHPAAAISLREIADALESYLPPPKLAEG